MNSLLKNAGIPQLRCRVIRGAFLYEVNVQGDWTPSNYQFASWMVEEARKLECKSRDEVGVWSRKKLKCSAPITVISAESSSKLPALTLPTTALSTGVLATNMTVCVRAVTGHANSREWKYEY